MTLKEYLKANKVSIKDLAKALNVTYSTAWYLINGGRAPTYEQACKVLYFTKGEVWLIKQCPVCKQNITENPCQNK